jgi:TrmH family RNA methyltransferase
MMKMITSLQNNQVKRWKKLQTRKERMKTGTFLVEGFHLIEEARASNWKIKEFIIREDVEIPSWCDDELIIVVSDIVFQHIAQTNTPQGIIAVIEMNRNSASTGNQVLMIDCIQDPGNLGTIIRTADAAGFSAVILGKGTVDLYNDKVIRATQGSLFHIPIIQGYLLEEINVLKQAGFTIWATALKHSKVYTEIPIPEKTALILGNEGAGVHEDILQVADSIVKIPIYGKAESLNVSIAAGILMYHLKR